jgi:hypothetical protein
MKLYIFRSAVESDWFAFTADPTGANLPRELAPWHGTTDGAATAYAGTSVDELAPSDPVLKAVDRDGFYLARSGFVISSTKGPDGRPVE